MKTSKSLKSYLIQLALVGLLCLSGGLMLTYGLFFKTNEYWSIYYLPFKLAGLYLAYWISLRGAPGGAVNYHFSKKTKNKDEIKLDKLVSNYTDKKLVNVVVFLFLGIYLILNIINYSPNAKFNFSDGIFFTLILFFTTLALCEGTKYISTWWNLFYPTKR